MMGATRPPGSAAELERRRRALREERLYAQQRAQEWDGRLVCLATAEGKDEEMKKRLAPHRARRRSRCWETIEEPLEVVWQLKELDDSVGAVVLDCVTLWVSNTLLNNQREELENQVAELVEEIPLFPFHFLAISNEVGLGLVPETPLGRVVCEAVAEGLQGAQRN